MSLRETMKNFNPDIIKCKVMDKTGYGYELANPIMIKNVETIYELARRMKLVGVDRKYCALANINKEETFYIEKFSGFVDHVECLFKVVRNGERCFELYDLYFCVSLARNKKYSKTEILMEINNLDDIILPEGFVL